MRSIEQICKDIEWIITNPTLIQQAPFGTNFLDILQNDIQQLSSQFKMIRTMAENISKEGQARRLGHYYEQILQHLFKYLGYAILLRNHQYFIGKQTAGEIDFVVERAGIRYHIEVAFKVYAAYPSKNGSYTWIGPNARDHLINKWNQMFDKQLTAFRYSAKYDLPIDVDEVAFINQGRLYVPTNFDISSYDNQIEAFKLNMDCVKGVWINHTAEVLNNLLEKDFLFIERPAWISCYEGIMTGKDIIDTNFREFILRLDNQKGFNNFEEYLILENSWPYV